MRWRRDFEAARPWGLLQFGLLSLIAGWLMARSEEGTAFTLFGLVLAAAGVAAMVRAVRLFRARPPDAS